MLPILAILVAACAVWSRRARRRTSSPQCVDLWPVFHAWRRRLGLDRRGHQ